MRARELAVLALLYFFKKKGFLDSFFERDIGGVSSRDLRLAKEIAYGTCRRLLSLEYLADRLCGKRLKGMERIIIYMSIYQFFFMKKVPIFSIVNEAVELAKRYLKGREGFINAILRKMGREKLLLPKGSSIEEMSYLYSYPPFFIEKLIEDFGKKMAENILKVGNKVPAPQVRVRKGELPLKPILDGMFKVYSLSDLTPFVGSKDYYVQNMSYPLLMEEVVEHIDPPPKNILDLAAAPGGKLILLGDIFKKAGLYANDISKKRLGVLKGNLKKYGMDATCYNEDGSTFLPGKRFDLVVIDAPCSNSGVLNKRAEARWRIDRENLKRLQNVQVKLLKNGSKLLSKDGKLLYITCSVLKDENERVVEMVKDLKVIKMGRIFPSELKDGVFFCLLKP